MTNAQRYYTLLGLVCEDFPHYAVEMAMDAGYAGERQRLHDVKRRRTVDLPALVALVRHSLPRFELPAHLLPGEESLGARVVAFVKELFLLYRVEKLEVSSRWLAQAIGEDSKQRLDEYEVRHYLKRERRLAASPVPVRLKIPVAVTYEQGGPEITTYYTEIGRAYTLLVQDWLSQEELAVFSSPITPEQQEVAA